MKDNEKLDYKNINGLVQTARVILKLGLVLAICGLIAIGFVILEKTQILGIIGTILGLLLPLFIGFVVAWLFEPLIKYFEGKNITRKLSTVIVYVVFILVLMLLIGLVIPEFISQLKDLISQAPVFLNKGKELVVNLFSRIKDSEIDINKIQTDIIVQFENFVNNFASNSLTNLINGITNVFSEGFKVVLGLIIGFYLSLDFEKVVNGMKSYMPRKHKKDIQYLLDNLNNMARSYVSGTLFTSLIVAFLTF